MAESYLKKSALRAAIRFQEFQDAVLPMIRDMPGRTSLFYGELIGKTAQTVQAQMNRMEKIGILKKTYDRRRGEKNPLARWYLADNVQDNGDYSLTEHGLRKNKDKKSSIDQFITEDDLQWQKFYQLPRLERIRIQMEGNDV